MRHASACRTQFSSAKVSGTNAQAVVWPAGCCSCCSCCSWPVGPCRHRRHCCCTQQCFPCPQPCPASSCLQQHCCMHAHHGQCAFAGHNSACCAAAPLLPQAHAYTVAGLPTIRRLVVNADTTSQRHLDFNAEYSLRARHRCPAAPRNPCRPQVAQAPAVRHGTLSHRHFGRLSVGGATSGAKPLSLWTRQRHAARCHSRCPCVLLAGSNACGIVAFATSNISGALAQDRPRRSGQRCAQACAACHQELAPSLQHYSVSRVRQSLARGGRHAQYCTVPCCRRHCERWRWAAFAARVPAPCDDLRSLLPGPCP